LDSAHKSLVGNGHLRSGIAAVGPAFELVYVKTIVSKEVHLSKSDVLLLQREREMEMQSSQLLHTAYSHNTDVNSREALKTS